MAEPVHRRQNSRGRSTLLKVVILGDGGVGKSCLMHRYVSERFDENSYHTIGVEFLNKEIYLNGELFTLQIWDTAGQERFKSLRTPFYRGSDMCLLTFALDDHKSFENLDNWKSEFLYYADVKADFPFMVVGNKADLPREVTEEEVQEFCRNNALSYTETSAKEATNVVTAFTTCLQRWAASTASIQESIPMPDALQLGTGATASRGLCSSGCS